MLTHFFFLECVIYVLYNPFALEFGVRNILRTTQVFINCKPDTVLFWKTQFSEDYISRSAQTFFPHTIKISSVLYKHSLRLKWLLHSLVAEFSGDIVYSGFHWGYKWFNSLKHLVPEGHLCKARNRTRITLSLSPCDGSKAEMWAAFPQRTATPWKKNKKKKHSSLPSL